LGHEVIVRRDACRHRASTLGEHTDEILTELGYGPAQIVELRARNVV
jgi:crotonobetainyl-CoA:carnitine CoA-transferase CaiB-like acyl-CoA transferase